MEKLLSDTAHHPRFCNVGTTEPPRKDPEGKILHAFGKSSWVQQFVLKMQYDFSEALI